MKGIFHILKNGILSKIFQDYIKTVESYQSGRKKGKKYLPEDHIVKTRKNRILELSAKLRFVMFFIAEDWSSHSSFTRSIDLRAFPDALFKMHGKKDFKEFFLHLTRHIDEDLKERLASFSDIEVTRLDEAFLNLTTGAYFSSIVMSVSAVEARLHTIIKREKPILYKKDKLDQAPLGHLSNVITQNRKYKTIKENLPQKYFSLVNLCNSYRIFSAHPKEEEMNYPDTFSILALTLSFLLKPDLVRSKKVGRKV